MQYSQPIETRTKTPDEGHVVAKSKHKPPAPRCLLHIEFGIIRITTVVCFQNGSDFLIALENGGRIGE